MSQDEQILFTFEEAAKRLKVTDNFIEDRLKVKKLFCSIRLTGNFRLFGPSGNYKEITIGEHLYNPRYNEFLIQNYSEVFPGISSIQFDPHKLELLRFENDGFIYLYRDEKIHSDQWSINKKDVFISKEEIERFEKESCIAPEPSKRHVPKKEEHKSKDKSDIRLATEAFLDELPNGNKAGFYTFLKAKIKLTTEAILKNGEGYDIFFMKVTESGSKEGVYLNHSKERKKEGEPGWNHYSSADITTLISREKGRRK